MAMVSTVGMLNALAGLFGRDLPNAFRCTRAPLGKKLTRIELEPIDLDQSTPA